MISIKRIEQGKLNYEIYFNKEDLLFIKKYPSIDKKYARYDVNTMNYVRGKIIDNIEFQIKGGDLTILSVEKSAVSYFEVGGLDNDK